MKQEEVIENVISFFRFDGDCPMVFELTEEDAEIANKVCKYERCSDIPQMECWLKFFKRRIKAMKGE